MRMATLQIKDFPDDLHRDAKVEAARGREALRDLVARAVQREVERLRRQRKDDT